MPEIIPIKILSFSSEDQLYPVKNLLKGSSLYQWKCKNASEIETYVDFQFEKLTRFTRIEIGNQCSAFIEIKVSRSLTIENYQVLLGLTALMSPSEALRFENLNRVKYFKEFDFSKDLSQEKWDIIRVVLTQPFNRTLQYGLSFIKFFGEINSVIRIDQTEIIIPDQKIDISKMLNASNDEDIKPGSLFINRNKADESSNLNDIKIKVTNKKSSSESVSSSNDNVQLDSNTLPKKVKEKKLKKLSPEVINDSINTKQNQDNISKKSSLLSTHKRKIQDSDDEVLSESKKVKLDSIPNSNGQTKSTSIGSSSYNSKTTADFTNISKKIHDMSSRNVFKDVVFVLSGYLNPMRNDLRDKALLLGAKYRSSWTDDCTHLICAFNNTPKFKEVCGKGIIVSEKWIIESFTQKKLLNWRDFRLRGSTSPPKTIKSTSSSKRSDSSCNSSFCKNLSDVKDEPSTSKDNNTSCNQIGNQQDTVSIDSLPSLPDLFESMNFFFYGNFENDDLQFFKRLIVTFGGVIHEYMDPMVRIVITNSFWDHNFDEAIEANPDLKFIKSSWLNACDEQNSLVPFDDFEITR